MRVQIEIERKKFLLQFIFFQSFKIIFMIAVIALIADTPLVCTSARRVESATQRQCERFSPANLYGKLTKYFICLGINILNAGKFCFICKFSSVSFVKKNKN